MVKKEHIVLCLPVSICCVHKSTMFSYLFSFICLTASRKGESSGTSSIEFTSKVLSTTNQDTYKSQVIIHYFQTNLKDGENNPQILQNLII